MQYKLLILLILFSSCVNTRKVEKFLDKNKDYSSKICSEKYPVKTDTFITYQLDTVNIVDKIFINLPGDTIKRNINADKWRTLVKTITITKENTASIKYLELLRFNDSLKSIAQEKKCKSLTTIIDKKEIETKLLKAQKRNYWWLIVLLIAIIVSKPIFKLATKTYT